MHGQKNIKLHRAISNEKIVGRPRNHCCNEMATMSCV